VTRGSLFTFERLLLFVAFAVLCLLLSGCNMVASEKPWFSVADNRNSPALKPGIWGSALCKSPQELECRMSYIEVGVSQMRPFVLNKIPTKAGDKTSPLTEERIDYQVVAESPIIIQIRVRITPELNGVERLGGYIYLGFIPTERDPDGEVIAGDVWPLVCGPQPKQGDENYGYTDDQGRVTNHPMRGLTMVGEGCVAHSKRTLERVARTSRTMDGAPLSVRWQFPPVTPKAN
jgi:hypothetical protein